MEAAEWRLEVAEYGSDTLVPNQGQPTSRVLRRTLLVLSVAIVIALVALATKVFFLVFSSILLALFLTACSGWVQKKLGVRHGFALAIVVVILFTTVGATAWLLAPQVSRQFQGIGEELPRAWDEFRTYVANQPWGAQTARLLPDLQKLMADAPAALSKAFIVVSSTLGFVADLLVFVIVGIYLAAEPRKYVNGFLQLVPTARRRRAEEVVHTLGGALQRWLVGRLALMALNALVTAIGLMLLRVPMAFALGLLSGVLNFVPTIGPIIAAVPAILLAFTISPGIGIATGVFFLAYQMLDGYVFEPLVQRRTVSMAPALTLVAQVLMGVMLGPMGVVLAVPLMAVIVMLVKMMYVQDTLGQPVCLPGEPEPVAPHSKHPPPDDVQAEAA